MEKWLWWLFLRKESGQSNLEQSRAFLFSYLLFLMLLAHPDPKRELNWIRRHVKSGTKGNLAAAPPCVTTGTHGVRWCPAHLCQGSWQGTQVSQVSVLFCKLLILSGEPSGCLSKLLLLHLFFGQCLDLTEKQIIEDLISGLFHPLHSELWRMSSVNNSSALPTIWTHLNNVNSSADQLLRGASLLRIKYNSAPWRRFLGLQLRYWCLWVESWAPPTSDCHVPRPVPRHCVPNLPCYREEAIPALMLIPSVLGGTV